MGLPFDVTFYTRFCTRGDVYKFPTELRSKKKGRTDKGLSLWKVFRQSLVTDVSRSYNNR